MAHLFFAHLIKGSRAPLCAVLASLLVLFGGLAIAAQDRYTLRIPDGLSVAMKTGKPSPSVKPKPPSR